MIQKLQYEYYRVHLRRYGNFYCIKQASISSNSMRRINNSNENDYGNKLVKQISPQKTSRIELEWKLLIIST